MDNLKVCRSIVAHASWYDFLTRRRSSKLKDAFRRGLLGRVKLSRCPRNGTLGKSSADFVRPIVRIVVKLFCSVIVSKGVPYPYRNSIWSIKEMAEGSDVFLFSSFRVALFPGATDRRGGMSMSSILLLLESLLVAEIYTASYMESCGLGYSSDESG